MQNSCIDIGDRSRLNRDTSCRYLEHVSVYFTIILEKEKKIILKHYNYSLYIVY